MDPFRGADKKLSELMLRGWALLGENCPVSNCQCPLMRSPDMQKYCVNCEEWIYDKKKREKKKFNELFTLSMNQIKQEKKENIIKKNVEQQKESKQCKKENNEKEKEEITNIDTSKVIPNESVVDLLDNKLKRLAQNLNEETDIKKSELIIGLMDKIMGLIEHYKKIK